MSFSDLIQYITTTLEDDDIPEIITLAIRLFSEITKIDPNTLTTDYANCCAFLAANLQPLYTGKIEMIFYHYRDKIVSLTEYDKRRIFKNIYHILCMLNGHLLDPENPHKSEIECVKINLNDMVEIDSGDYGIVYKYQDLAVKSSEHKGLHMDALIKEIATLSILQGMTHIPQLHFLSLDDESFHIGMQFFPRTLIDVIETGTTGEHIYTLCKNYAQGLYNLYEKGIVHRDIKLANLMLDENGRGYIIDFGSSMINPSTESIDNYFGTDSFRDYVLLKDQANRINKSVIGYEIDVWSLGIVFYFIVMRKSPFSFDGNYLNYSLIIENNIDEAISKIDNEFFRELIRGMLDLNPETRLTAKNIIEYFN